MSEVVRGMKFGHIAGDGFLDLLNTVDWRLGGPDQRERLTSFNELLDWCVESHVASTGEAEALQRLARREPAEAEQERRRVLDLRELAYLVLWVGDTKAGAELANAYVESLQTAALTWTDGHWGWEDQVLQLSNVRHRITRGLIDLVRRDDLDRLHQCEDVRCGWVYLDSSPRRNRRWCNAKDCGDRNRARAYYARKKRTGQAT